MMRAKLLLVGILAVALLVFSGDVLAGTTGKLNGVVRDPNGAPLPGANVILKGTRIGATADADGYYVIINIPPGEYTVTASLVGFETVSKTGVLVIVDQTSTVDFVLKEAAVELGELVVTAERPLVEPDKTTSKYTMSLDETERLLATTHSVTEMLALQPGVSVDGVNRVRGAWVDASGGRANDVAYVVDGIRMNYNDGRGHGGNFREVNRAAVQELSILTGVTPAEYGNAQGGVVQIVTKDGGNNYHGWVEYRYEKAGKKHWGANVYDAPQLKDNVKWDENDWINERWPDLTGKVTDPVLLAMGGELVHVRTDYDKQSGFSVEGNLSGPILKDRASFVLTARHSQLANPYPGPERTGFYDDRNRFVASGNNNLNISGSVTFRPVQDLRVKVGGLYKGWRIWATDRPDAFGKSRASGVDGVVRGTNRNLFLPEHWSAAGRQKFTEEMEYAIVTHTISPKTFYEVRISRSRSRQDTVSGTHQVTTDNNWDKSGYFNVGREAARWGLSDRKRWGLRADLSSQITKGHFVKTGIEFLSNSLWITQLWNSSPSKRGLLVLADKGRIGHPVHPYFINLYAQDKMEFEGMIVNVGVRMDAFNPNARRLTHGAYRGSPMFRTYTRARDYAYDKGSIWSTQAPWHVRFSPRIGISHPITERAQFRFSSGVFLQWADLWYYFGEDYYADGVAKDMDINGNGVIDDTEKYNTMMTTYSGQNGTHLLRPAKTTAFEVGMDWNFVADYTAAVTAYYKSEVEQFTWYPNETWQGVRDIGVKYSRTLDNGSYGDTRGLELSLRKAFSNNFAFTASYNYQYTEFTTGKLGNVIRNIYTPMDAVKKMATTIAYTDEETGAQVPEIWVEWAPHPSGREVPVIMTPEDIEKYGGDAQKRYEAHLKALPPGKVLGTGVWDGFRTAEGPAGERGVQLLTGGYSQLFLRPKGGDHKHFGSLSLMMSLPDDFQAGPRFLGNMLKNTRVNVIARFETGGLYSYTPPTGGTRTYRDLAMDSRTDLSVEKTFNVKSRVQPTLFLDVRNLFNQKDRNRPSSRGDWTYYGIDGPRPNDANYLAYGDARDRSYANTPRTVNVGLRVGW